MSTFGNFLKKHFLPFLLPILLIIAGTVLSVWGIKDSIIVYNKTKLDESDLGIAEGVEMPEGITSIALFGVDARNENYVGLSDSIMILTVDSVHNDIKLVSIMRDSLVKVEGLGYQKINAAYSYGSARGGAQGGAQLAVKTINQNFNLAIRDYATVDFVGMADLIDMVGGIDAELTAAEVKNANKQIREMHKKRGTPNDLIEEAGEQRLNGIQAVAWARVRKVKTVDGVTGDMGRTQRQRHVMYQLFKKAVKMKLTDYPAMVEKMLPCMETSLEEDEILDLAALLVNKGLQFKQARIPADEAIIQHGLYVKGRGSCMYYNLEYASAQLRAFLYEDISFEEYMETNGVDRTPWFTGETYDPNAPTEEPVPEDGTLPDGTLPDGTLPDGTLPDGTLPDGTNPDGTLPDGTNPDGTNPDGTLPDGTNPDGTNPDGTNPDGTNPDGTNPDGTNPDGTNPDGTNPDGTNPGVDVGGEVTPNPDPNPEPNPSPEPTPTPDPGNGGVVSQRA